MNLKYIAFILLGIGFYFFFFQSTPEEPTIGLEEGVESFEEESEVIEEVVEDEPKEVPKSQQPVQAPAQLKAPKTAKGPNAKYPDLDDSFAPFDEEGNRYITQVNQVGRHLVYDGDVLIGEAKDLKKLLKNKVIKMGTPGKWPSGRIPYVIDHSIHENQANQIVEAMEYLNTFTDLTIVPREESDPNYVNFTVGEHDCYSYAGMVGGEQPIYLESRCGVREILHEMMHTMGFLHEQNRGDRDRYVKILWDNIHEDNQAQFKKLPIAFMGLAGRPFDYKSIMLYSSYTFSLDPQQPSMLSMDGEIIPPTKNLLSDEDILRINLVY